MVETRHEACSGRASLATASVPIRTDSGRAASRRHAAVIALSTVVMRIGAVFRSSSHVMAAQEAPPGPGQARTDDRLRAISSHRDTRRSASSELTRRQHIGAFCIDPEPARGVFTNSKRHCGLPGCKWESVKRPSRILAYEATGIVMSGLFDDGEGRATRALDRSCWAFR